MQSKKRLSKTLSAAGVASRRACEELIFSGRVSVNGEITLLPQTMVDEDDTILVDGKPISKPEKLLYLVLNKPAGYVCSTVGKTKKILDLFKDFSQRLFTVGRLDKETTGLIIITNDGHFANKVIHPSSQIQKEYLAKTDHEITHEHLVAISSGTIVEGCFVKPIRVSKVRKGTLKITIAEGKKREVRLLLESVGLNVIQLSRIRIGGLHLGSLPLGQWRHMTESEKKAIFTG